MVNTSFRLNAANKAFFCCSVRLRKALIKYRGQNFFEYSFRNNIHVKISKYGVPLRALVPCKCYCECSIQTIFFPSRERQNEVWKSSASPRKLNEPIKLVCVFEKLSTNQCPRVRSWPCRLHESEIRGQGNQRFFSLTSSLLRLVVPASRLAVDLFREEKSRKTSGTRVLLIQKGKRYGIRSSIRGVWPKQCRISS